MLVLQSLNKGIKFISKNSTLMFIGDNNEVLQDLKEELIRLYGNVVLHRRTELDFQFKLSVESMVRRYVQELEKEGSLKHGRIMNLTFIGESLEVNVSTKLGKNICTLIELVELLESRSDLVVEFRNA